MPKSFSECTKSERTLAVVGGVLVVVGACALVWRYMSVSWVMIVFHAVLAMLKLMLPLALMGLGVYLIWAWKTGRLARGAAGPGGGRLHASLSDKRIGGVCGGVAQYLGLDSTMVRVIVLLVAIATSFFLMALAYLCFMIALPKW